MFKQYLITNDKYLSYKKKALYAWLRGSTQKNWLISYKYNSVLSYSVTLN